MKVTPKELYDEWTSGESSGVSAHRAQYLREELMEYSGRYIPHRIPELESMLDRSGVRGQITKELKAAAGEAESDEDDDEESEDSEEASADVTAEEVSDGRLPLPETESAEDSAESQEEENSDGEDGE